VLTAAPTVPAEGTIFASQSCVHGNPWVCGIFDLWLVNKMAYIFYGNLDPEQYNTDDYKTKTDIVINGTNYYKVCQGMPDSVNTLYIERVYDDIVYPKKIKHLIINRCDIGEICNIPKIGKLTIIWGTSCPPIYDKFLQEYPKSINFVIHPRVFNSYRQLFIEYFNEFEVGKIWIGHNIDPIDGWSKEYIRGTTIFTKRQIAMKSARATEIRR